MDLGLNGKIAVITGSSRGLGYASARALLDEGCSVVICARNKDQLELAADQLRETVSDDRVLAVQADLSADSGVTSVIEEAVEKYGGLDVLVNNVGQAGGSGIVETSDAEWELISFHAIPEGIHDMPMRPVTMMRNQLQLTGGTKAYYKSEDWAESVNFWQGYAMLDTE